MPRTFAAFAHTVSAILAATDPKSCSRIYRKALATFDVDSFAVGEVDLSALERTVFYAIGWPDSYRKFYTKSGLVHRDPVVEGLRHRHGPFTWSELRKDRKLSILGTEALQALYDHGWTEGLAVPIPRGNLRFGLIGLACRRNAFSAIEKSLLTMLSLCFHERLRNLAPEHGFAVPPLGLTRREIESLRLIARGMTDREVGKKLGISPSTAHEHFETAKKKLNVSTRAQAVAVAVSLAIVTP
jgi:LuxR family transcriptional regulator, quorum-sensing system regulator BjaR1